MSLRSTIFVGCVAVLAGLASHFAAPPYSIWFVSFPIPLILLAGAFYFRRKIIWGMTLGCSIAITSSFGFSFWLTESMIRFSAATSMEADFSGNPDVLVNLVQDGWYNARGRSQHFELGRIRAIEYRKSFVRAANSGPSGVVGPSGRLITPVIGPPRSDNDVEEIQITSVPIFAESTVFSRFGLWWLSLPSFAVILQVMYASWHRVKS